MAEEPKVTKEEIKTPEKLELTKEELTILIQVLNQPRQQDLQTAARLIELSNKLSKMADLKK